jgi:hypothetical protein
VLCGFFSVNNAPLVEAVSAFKAIVLAPSLPIPHARLPFQRRETAKDIPIRVQNERQCVCVSVASLVKVYRAETVAISSPQKHKSLPAELVEEWRKGRDDQ